MVTTPMAILTKPTATMVENIVTIVPKITLGEKNYVAIAGTIVAKTPVAILAKTAATAVDNNAGSIDVENDTMMPVAKMAKTTLSMSGSLLSEMTATVPMLSLMKMTATGLGTIVMTIPVVILTKMIAIMPVAMLAETAESAGVLMGVVVTIMLVAKLAGLIMTALMALLMGTIATM